jgi:D-alanyl-D-alanine carboxypeptidase
MKSSTSRRLIPGLAFIAVVVITAIALSGEALAQEPPSIDELARRIERTQSSVAANPPRGDAIPPDEARDATAPATVLFGVVNVLDELVEGRGGADLGRADMRRLRDARDAALRAFSDYGTSNDIAGVLRSLRNAAKQLQSLAPSRSDANHGRFEQLSKELATVAHSIATDLVALAANAGATSINVAETRLRVGERLMALGQYAAAIGEFGGATGFAANVISFDIDMFEQNIQDALDGQTIGHAYTIGRDDVLYSEDGADGDARTTADPPQTDQSDIKEMQVASMSKTISALALLKALADEGISVDESISGYLPSSWTQGPKVADITFRLLLTHRSGLDPGGTGASSASAQTLEPLRQIIEAGSPGFLGFSGAKYTNANYSLLRILIPQITIGEEVISIYANVLPEDFVYAALYAQYVANEVLGPAGIDALFCSPDDSADSRTLYYSFAAPAVSGIDLGDWSLSCGAAGWTLSAVELGALLAFTRYTESIIDDESRELMDEGFLGWLNPITFSGLVDGVWGVYRAHGGDLGGDAGVTGCMMKFHIQVQATLVINSRGGDLGGHACTLLKDAFDNAWASN